MSKIQENIPKRAHQTQSLNYPIHHSPEHKKKEEKMDDNENKKKH